MDNETLTEEMELEQEPDFVMDTASEVTALGENGGILKENANSENR